MDRDASHNHGRSRWSCALVTGASSGIGDAFARELAAEGTDLVVVARDTDRLDRLAAELRRSHGVTVEVMTADLSDPAQVELVARRLGDDRRRVDLVVNNAGFGTSGTFWDMPAGGELDEIAVNVSAVVRLTHAALGPMVERGAGTVINVSSVAGLIPAVGNATYGATKAFLNSFGDAIHEELSGTGASLTTVLPGYTRTEFQQRANSVDDAKIRVPDQLWCSPDQVAIAALDGAAAGHARVVPGVVYAAGAVVLEAVPSAWLRRLTGSLVRRR